MVKICEVCKKEIVTSKRKTKFHKECFYKSKRFHPIFNKNKKLSKKHKQNISESIKKWGHPKSWKEKVIGSNAPWWRGNNASYIAIHRWVRKHYKKSYCESCKESEKMLHMANKSGQYNRDDPSDWLTLCVSCHKKFDLSR